jgi:hypothetical protein
MEHTLKKQMKSENKLTQIIPHDAYVYIYKRNENYDRTNVNFLLNF